MQPVYNTLYSEGEGLALHVTWESGRREVIQTSGGAG